MGFDVFVSHSVKDKTTADAVCAKLEGAGIRCWIAPRDVPVGKDWAEAIIDGISSCRAMVFIFSNHSNQSKQVRREVQSAFEMEKVVLPFRIDEVTPVSGLKFYIDSVHWLDAFTKPLEKHIDSLIRHLKSILSIASEQVDDEVIDQPHEESFTISKERETEDLSAEPPSRLTFPERTTSVRASSGLLPPADKDTSTIQPIKPTSPTPPASSLTPVTPKRPPRVVLVVLGIVALGVLLGLGIFLLKPKLAPPAPQPVVVAPGSSASSSVVGTSDNGRFKKYASGVILDTKTNLEWFPGPEKNHTFDAANSWVSSLTAVGGGWRMPLRNELAGLSGKYANGCYLDSIFGYRDSCIWVWSGEIRDSSSAWGFYVFYGGKEGWSPRDNSSTSRVLAVRSR